MQSQYLIIFAVLGWGIGSLFNKVANDNMHPIMVSATATVVFIILLGLTFAFYKFDYKVNSTGIIAATVGGLCMCLASMAYFYALRGGHAGIITALTSMYPVLTLILSMIFLKETITMRQGIGVVFAIIAFILMSFK